MRKHPVYKINHRIPFLLSKYFITFVTYLITTMNTRLKQFLAAENITQAQFADSINVVRASVSHVLSGRNNPSYDFIKAVMLRYPRLNTEWLFFGKGKMYRDSPAEPVHAADGNDGLLFSDTNPIYEDQEAENPAMMQSPAVNTQPLSDITTLEDSGKTTVNQRKVSKIILLFDDGTFQEIQEMSNLTK